MSKFQACVECEHFSYDHESGTGHCLYGQSAVSDGCGCAEFETLSQRMVIGT